MSSSTKFASPDLASIAQRTAAAHNALELLRLIRDRKRASQESEPHAPCSRLKIALLSAYTAHPFVDFLEQHLFAGGHCVDWYIADFDSYMSQLLDPNSAAHAAKPDLVIVVPSNERCRYSGSLAAPPEEQQQQAISVASELLDACARFHAATRAEIILANFRLPGNFDLGAARARCSGSKWTFTKRVNLEIGTRAPAYVKICDLEFLAYRLGELRCHDARGWFQSKQMASAELQILAAAECARIIRRARQASKKVLALDLDNTLWGGVLAELGPEGIELGDTTPLGEAFKAFQRYILELAERGVILAVVSKNDDTIARAPFVSHPEMVLKEHHISAWRANWEPKSDNLKQIADELNLGLDSFVFVDDNPAEIAVVNQFAPEVETVQLSEDPSEFVTLLDERRFFEVDTVTVEDTNRTAQYRAEVGRRASAARVTNMDDYLASLDMKMAIRPFCSADAPRVAQLINKSNQFNLTTRRRTQAEVESLIDAHQMRGFSVRLTDRFGDHGLICAVILSLEGESAEIDTWLMSCRVLKRQVEDEVLNEIVRVAAQAARPTVIGRYLPTPKNGLVKDLLPSLGFRTLPQNDNSATYALDCASYRLRPTWIKRA